MRPLLAGDLDFAVRVLLARPQSQWRAASRALLEQAAKAHQFRRSFGKPHEKFGTGSVMSAAQHHELAVLPPTCDDAYCRALHCFLETFLEQRVCDRA